MTQTSFLQRCSRLPSDRQQGTADISPCDLHNTTQKGTCHPGHHPRWERPQRTTKAQLRSGHNAPQAKARLDLFQWQYWVKKRNGYIFFLSKVSQILPLNFHFKIIKKIFHHSESVWFKYFGPFLKGSSS